MTNPLRVTAEILGVLPASEYVDQVPHCFTDTLVLYGTPLTKLSGLDSVRCRFNVPRAKRFPGLGGQTAFLRCRNTSGTIELTFLQGHFSLAHLELFSASGVSFPLVISDLGSGGTASVIATACQVIDPGDWTREKEAQPVTVILEAARMAIFHGLRLPAFV